MGGSAPIQVYNECDVAALAQRIRPGKPLPELAPIAGPSSPVILAKKNGRRIMRTTAIKEFKVCIEHGYFFVFIYSRLFS
jgi:hypothetical protein